MSPVVTYLSDPKRFKQAGFCTRKEKLRVPYVASTTRTEFFASTYRVTTRYTVQNCEYASGEYHGVFYLLSINVGAQYLRQYLLPKYMLSSSPKS